MITAMNKTLLKITLGAACLMSFTACNDFLDKEVEGYATDKNFYDTQYKMQSALSLNTTSNTELLQNSPSL